MTPWPAEQLDQLKALVDEGLSTGDIAARMGISRGAVSGMIHRGKGALGTLRRKPGFQRSKSEAAAVKAKRPPRVKVAPPPLTPKLAFVAPPPPPARPIGARDIVVVPIPFSRAISEARCLFYACDDFAPASADMLVCGCKRALDRRKPYCAAHLVAETERAAA